MTNNAHRRHRSFVQRYIEIVLWIAIALPVAAWGQSVNWIERYGGELDDTARDVALFEDAVYVVGGTNDAAPLGDRDDSSDGYLDRYDRRGNLIWRRAFGDAQFNEAFTVYADVNGIYVGGSTVAPPADNLNPDTLVAKYDHGGNLLWARQFGKSAMDWASDIAADDSGVYVAGDFIIGREAYLYKFDHDGNELWQDVFGEPRRSQGFVYRTASVVTDGEGVYTTGVQPQPGISEDATDTDVFVKRYNTDGSLVWTRIIDANGSVFARDLAIDETGLYVTGDVSGILAGQTSAGGIDSFIKKLDRNSADLWTRQFGTNEMDRPDAMDVDAGQSYVFGDIGSGAIGVWAFDDQGNALWRLPLEGSRNTIAEGIAVRGGVGYLVGYSRELLDPEENLYRQDAFLANFTTTDQQDDIAVSINARPASFADAGERLEIVTLVANQSGEPLSNVMLVDPLLGTFNVGGLWPGISATVTALYTTTQADVLAGQIVFAPVITSSQTQPAQPTQFTVPLGRSVTIDLQASPQAFEAVGERITMSLLVKNNSDAPVFNITATITPLDPAPLCVIGSLWPGVETTCTGAYFITDEDVIRGHVAFNADVSADGLATPWPLLARCLRITSSLPPPLSLLPFPDRWTG